MNLNYNIEADTEITAYNKQVLLDLMKQKVKPIKSLDSMYYKLKPGSKDEYIKRWYEKFDTYSDCALSMISFLEDGYCTIFMHGDLHLNSTTIIIYAYDYFKLKSIKEQIKAVFGEFFIDDSIFIETHWYYRNTDSVVHETYNDIVHDEAYPYLHGGTDKFIDKFLASNNKLLLLVGSPGTGKTRFIRKLLSKVAMSKDDKTTNVIYTSDDYVLENNDEFFVDFIDSDAHAMILEDLDIKIVKRSQGNDFIKKILNVSDGLFQNQNKKIIISTNLPTIKDVDEALVRAGRCYKVLNFKKLNYEESIVFLAKLGYTNEIEDRDYSVAELYEIFKEGSFSNNPMEETRCGFSKD